MARRRLQIDLRVLPAEVYGNLLQHFTGSREHNIQLRELAVRKNLRVSENGIVDLGDGRLIACRTEAEVYAALGLMEIPPEMRLGVGEIEAARDGTLPAGRRTRGPPRRLPHAQPLERRRRRAGGDGRRVGGARLRLPLDLRPLAGRGSRPRCRRAWRAQRAACAPWASATTSARSARPRSTFCADGTLDYDDALLAELDIVVASVHTAMNQSRAEMTARLIRACENPFVTIIGHPTGRNVERFAGYEFDYDAVFAAAARTGTALEIDGQPVPAGPAQRARPPGARIRRDVRLRFGRPRGGAN